jgi:hypothetical protein
MLNMISDVDFNTTLRVSGVDYQYRYCDGCRREWAAEHTHCPRCLRWLGHQPRQRREWQIVPDESIHSASVNYEFVCAATFCLRIVGSQPTEHQLREIHGMLAQALDVDRHAQVLGVAGHGWLIWTNDGARRALLVGIALRDRLTISLPVIERTLSGGARLRWGVWVDSYVMPLDSDRRPIVGEAAAATLSAFEPDGQLLISENIFRANRRWEQFVCVPVRRQGVSHGYVSLGRKRPSALDHAKTVQSSPFIARVNTLKRLESLWRASQEAIQKVAIVAPAGSGKTRLISEWLQRHSETASLRANFSIFGGDAASFAAQLADLPEDTLDVAALVAQVQDRIRRERVGILILDDLHWADEAACEFLTRLVASLPVRGMLLFLCSRPSGRCLARRLGCATEIRLRPLAAVDVDKLASRLGSASGVAALAARLSRGNPLFVEQFSAWAAESHYTGRGSCPQTLHQVIDARLQHLENVRLKNLRMCASCSGISGLFDFSKELDEIESEIGLWLDRLETGDYADGTEVVRYLARLERIDFELFLTGTHAGRPRSHSSRLREAIERLFLGSSDCILSDMTARARCTQNDDVLNLQHEAARFGECAASNYRWDLAATFFKLALDVAPGENKLELRKRLDECDRHLNVVATSQTATDSERILETIERDPTVDALYLADVWFKLGQRFASRRYYLRAAEAAQAVGDRAFAELASRSATHAQVD